MKVIIAVDAMGGDHGLAVTVPAAAQFLKRHPDTHLIMVGDQTQLTQAIAQYAADFTERITIEHADEVVQMDESPQSALKNKKKSSMRIAINMVKEQKAQAIVSAGNTGALMATARFVLKMLNNVDRPAIAKFLPSLDTNQAPSCMLDLGANADNTPEQLLQFAVMGSALFSCVHNVQSPKVGLLNIGSEEMKGTETIRDTYLLLKESSLNFIGNIEGDDIFKGKANVIVCEGFVGNVALKTVEGTAKLFAHYMRKSYAQNIYNKFCALMSRAVLKTLRQYVDPRRYNGAIFLGLRGVVIKSHGGTDATGFAFALQEAYEEVKCDILNQVALGVEKHMSQVKAHQEIAAQNNEE